MKTMLRLTLVAGVLAIVGLALTPLFAQDGPPQQEGQKMRRMGPGGPGGFGPGGRGGPGDIGLPLRALELTDGQREQVRGVMQSNQAAFRDVGDRMRTAHEALDAAVTAATVDEPAIRARAAELAAVQADAAVLRAKVHQEVFGLLTAEQQAKANELKAGQKMKRRAGPGQR